MAIGVTTVWRISLHILSFHPDCLVWPTLPALSGVKRGEYAREVRGREAGREGGREGGRQGGSLRERGRERGK